MKVILSGKPVSASLEATPIGVFDVIRDDIRLLSTVKPVDRIFVERTDTGYRGVLFCNEIPHLFFLGGEGIIVKPVDNGAGVFDYCSRLEDEERMLTAQLDAQRADTEIEMFNILVGEARPREHDFTVQPEEGPVSTLRMWGPVGIADPIERVPGAYRKMMQGASLSRKDGKKNDGVCGGGIVVNKEGKILLVKPRDGYGGYDWTFPKGYPAVVDEGHLERTAIREVHEESGYRVFANRYIGRFTHNDGGMCDYFCCDIDGSKPVGHPDPYEIAAIKWVTVVEALELLNDDVDVRILAQANNLLPRLLVKSGHTGAMVALYIPEAIAKRIALPGGEEPSSLHITLVYLGKGLSEHQKKTAASVVRKFAGSIGNGIRATLGGVGRFSASGTSEGRDVIYLSVDSPQITRWRPELVNDLEAIGLRLPENHGFVPHVTLAYVKKDDETPLKRLEPIDVKFDSVSLTMAGRRMSFVLKLSEENRRFIEIGRRNYRAIMMKKALPRLSNDQRDEKAKKVGAKVGGAVSKQAGATGKTRYNYPNESQSGGDGKQQNASNQSQPIDNEAGQMQQDQDVLPNPDTPHPQPVQEPIVVEHPDKPPVDDPRSRDPQSPMQPKHTLNVAELCAALGIQRQVLEHIVNRMQTNFGAEARSKFVSFMTTHMKDFINEHGLDGDYFGLLFDVLTGKVPEGLPAAMAQQQQQQSQGGGNRGAST